MKISNPDARARNAQYVAMVERSFGATTSLRMQVAVAVIIEGAVK